MHTERSLRTIQLRVSITPASKCVLFGLRVALMGYEINQKHSTYYIYNPASVPRTSSAMLVNIFT